MNETYLEDLNPQQLQAVTTTEGPVLILAGAGSGKTKSLISRVAYLINNGCPAEKILLLTFTNKAAKEMKDRAVALLDEKCSKITASTFHSFCARLLRQHISKLGFRSNFTIIDEEDAADVIDILKLDDKYAKVIKYKDFPKKKKIISIRSNALNFNRSTESVIPGDLKKYTSTILLLLSEYELYKKEHNLVDYDDLLLHTVTLLKTFEPVRAVIENSFKYIMCDEYQDTNYLQDEIISLLRRKNKNIAVVGDDNQSIYRFRGANIENILSFEQKYPGTKKIVLFENYRSSSEIVSLSNQLMADATEGYQKELHSQFDEGTEPRFIVVEDGKEECDFILKGIKTYLAKGVHLNQMAVIVRSAWQSNRLETVLAKEQIPFQKFGGMGFLSTKIAKDVLAFFRIITNDCDEIAWFRVLSLFVGVGEKKARKVIEDIEFRSSVALAFTMPELYQFVQNLKEMDNMADMMDAVLGFYFNLKNEQFRHSKRKTIAEEQETFEQNFEDAKDVFSELAAEFKSVEAFLEGLALDYKKEDKNTDKLNITTIHSAKGLEYDIVFLMDCIDSVCPPTKDERYYCRDINSDGFDYSFNTFPEAEEKFIKKDAEERRCFYVAVTRARYKLFLIYPRFLGRHGSMVIDNPSHYLLNKKLEKTLDIFVGEVA